MAALLVGLSFVMGPIQVLKLYGVPYWVNFIFLSFIYFLVDARLRCLVFVELNNAYLT